MDQCRAIEDDRDRGELPEQRVVVDAIGQRIQSGVVRRGQTSAAQNPWLTIVGVVGNIKSDGFDAASAPHLYRPLYQAPSYDGAVYLRTSMDPGALGDSVRAEVRRVDPTIPVFNVRTMDAIVSAFLAERRFALELLGIFAGVALIDAFNAVLYIFGVILLWSAWKIALVM